MFPITGFSPKPFDDAPVYPVAGKCGVFAETDIIGLEKQGVPQEHLLASLFQAIVLQNLSVLTRGNTLMPKVFLLGGPNAYFPGLQAAWRKGLLELWKRKNIRLPEDASPETSSPCLRWPSTLLLWERSSSGQRRRIR